MNAEGLNVTACFSVYQVGLMRNGRLLAEDSPNTLMNLYKEDVSSCADAETSW